MLIANFLFLETFDDLRRRDLIWAHAISNDRLLSDPAYDTNAPLVALIKRGLRDPEQNDEPIGFGQEQSMRYAASVGGGLLEYCHILLNM